MKKSWYEDNFKIFLNIFLILQLSFSGGTCTTVGTDGTGDCVTNKNLNCKEVSGKKTCHCADKFVAVNGKCVPDLGKLISMKY